VAATQHPNKEIRKSRPTKLVTRTKSNRPKEIAPAPRHTSSAGQRKTQSEPQCQEPVGHYPPVSSSSSIRKKKLREHAALRAVRGVRVNVIRRTCCVHTCGLILAVSTQSETLERNSAIHHAPPRIHPHANVKNCVGT